MEESRSVKKIQGKCPSCGASLKFSPTDAGLHCAFCNTVQKLKYNKNVTKKDYSLSSEDRQGYSSFAQESKVFACNNCGAKVVLNNLEVAKSCPYCGGSCVMDNSEMSGLSPDAIIPFKFSTEQAIELYKQGVKKKWFLPNKFKKSPPTDNVNGVYIPCFSFDANTHTEYHGKLSTNHTRRLPNGKTQTYKTYQTIMGNHDMSHQDILVETSSHVDQAMFNELAPFNLNELVKFDSGFIMGYSVEHYNQSLQNCKTVGNTIMKQVIRRKVLSKYSYDNVEYFEQNTSFSNEKFSYCIFPTYQVLYKYKNKPYVTFMNGQTGKVGGGLPRSAVKITFFVLMWVIILAGIFALIYFS